MVDGIEIASSSAGHELLAMTGDPLHLVTRPLTEADTAARADLAALVNAYDGLDLPVTLDDGVNTSQALAYIEDELVGAAFGYQLESLESWIVVHPDYRRQGIGRRLVAALGEVAGGPFVLSSDERSASGVAFLAAIGARYFASEHTMVYRPELARPLPERTIVVRRARPDELDLLVHLTVTSFDDDESAFRPLIERWFASPNHRFWIAEREDRPIGAIRAAFEAGGVWLATFGILPGERGRGYGRQLLSAVVGELAAEGVEEIRLEVETENANALGLYESCGFRTVQTTRYYNVDPPKDES
jgi:ribosomal protein S18 acetylase RimI-like enzyme